MNSFTASKKLEITHFKTKHYIKDLTLKELLNDNLLKKKFQGLISNFVGVKNLHEIFMMDYVLLFLSTFSCSIDIYLYLFIVLIQCIEVHFMPYYLFHNLIFILKCNNIKRIFENHSFSYICISSITINQFI